MAGTITHEWNGTVLTITSDSGTSSADLRGATGMRGAQGPAGIGINGKDGTITFEELTEEQKASLKGKDGTVTFEELTEAQKATLKGDKGDKGDAYEITVEDYQEIANLVLSDIDAGAGITKHYHITNAMWLTAEEKEMLASWLTTLPKNWYITIGMSASSDSVAVVMDTAVNDDTLLLYMYSGWNHSIFTYAWRYGDTLLHEMYWKMLASIDYVDDAIEDAIEGIVGDGSGGVVDLSNYYTKEEVERLVVNAIADIPVYDGSVV